MKEHKQSIEYDDMLFHHGVRIVLQDGSEILTVLLLSLFLHQGRAAVLYTSTFAILRIHTGGLHAGTPAGCFIGYLAMYLAVTGYSLLPLNPSVCFFLSLISTLIILRNAPAEHILNPLTVQEYQYNRKCVRILIPLYLLTESVLISCGSMLYRTMSAVLILTALLLLVFIRSDQYGGNRNAS